MTQRSEVNLNLYDVPCSSSGYLPMQSMQSTRPVEVQAKIQGDDNQPLTSKGEKNSLSIEGRTDSDRGVTQYTLFRWRNAPRIPHAAWPTALRGEVGHQLGPWLAAGRSSYGVRTCVLPGLDAQPTARVPNQTRNWVAWASPV